MVNVWAYVEGNFTSSGAGWDIVIPITTLQSIVAELDKKRVTKGNVRKLGIFAHGNSGGLIQFKGHDLTKTTSVKLKGDLKSLNDYLWVNSRIIFYSCIAGRGLAGNILLNELSGKHFPKRHVIAFTRYGKFSGIGKQQPGKLWCATSNVVFADCTPSSRAGVPKGGKLNAGNMLNEYSIYAKWSYMGKIIKLPYDEVVRRIERKAKVIFTPKNVMQALNNPKERAQIEYIAIMQTNAMNELWNKVQKAPYNFTYGAGAGKLRVHKDGELTKLAGTHRHQGIVAVYKSEVIQKFKCASPSCPTHSNFRHICENFVKHIPNGPLV